MGEKKITVNENWVIVQQGDDCSQQGTLGFAAAIRSATIEEIANFVETHYCTIDVNEPSGYKVNERTKHPNEPLGRAIRGMKAKLPWNKP